MQQGRSSGALRVSWQQHAQAVIGRAGSAAARARGYRRSTGIIWRRAQAENRLVPAPVFVISPIRSGSTLLRVLLNSHSQIRAPHEMHLRNLQVRYAKDYTELAMGQLGLDQAELEHLLWDRVLHWELQRSGKRIIVDKTPGNAAVWQRLASAWPQARFIFLIRHPAAIAASLQAARPDRPAISVVNEVLDYGGKVQTARTGLAGPTVRYEDLTAAPEQTMRTLCRFLRVRWEPGMLAYGKHRHGPFRAGIGDWSPAIRTGAVQPARPLPQLDELPAKLRDLAGTWGYLPPGDPPPVRALRRGTPGAA